MQSSDLKPFARGAGWIRGIRASRGGGKDFVENKHNCFPAKYIGPNFQSL